MLSQDVAVCDDAATPHGPSASELIFRIEQVPFCRWHMRARIVMGSATFLDAFDALSLAFVLPILARMWSLSAIDIGWLIASSYVGQLAGALLFSRLAERYGRVRSAAVATVLMSMMCLGCATAAGFWWLVACRMIQGIGVGGEMPVAAAYISELSRAKGRGRFFMLYEIIFPVGLMMTGQVGALLVPLFGWQTLFLIGGIPGMIVALLILWLPESPRWLIAQNRLVEADAVIKGAEDSARRTNPGLQLPDPKQALAAQQAAAVTPGVVQRTKWRELLSPFYRGRTIVVWSLWACAYFVSNSLNNWMPTLYSTVYGLELRSALRAASMTNVAQVIALLICAFAIDRIGRRNWTVAAFLIAAVLLAVLATGSAHNVVMVMALATLAYGAVGSVNAVLYLYTPEIYPTRMRAIGTGLATSWLRLASAVGPTLVGAMMSFHGIEAVFLMFAGVAVAGAAAGVLVIETQGRRLEDIAPS